VETVRSSPSRISFAHFIGNIAPYAVVYANAVGMILTSCVFAFNRVDSGMSDIYNASPGTNPILFVLINCVFDRGVPSTFHATSGGLVYGSLTTATHTIWHFDTLYCPAELPPPTPDFSFSSAPSRSDEFHRSSPFLVTSGWTASNPFTRFTPRSRFHGAFVQILCYVVFIL
jgi:hypothetical protein